MARLFFLVLVACNAAHAAGHKDSLMGGPGKGWQCSVAGDFPQQAPKDQGPVGSCHIFPVTGLLEWAAHTTLSEADLFLHSTIFQERFFRPLVQAALFQGRIISEDDIKLLEGNGMLDDLRYGLNHGLVPQKLASYHEFLWGKNSYLIWRRALTQAINRVAEDYRRNPDHYRRILNRRYPGLAALFGDRPPPGAWAAWYLLIRDTIYLNAYNETLLRINSSSTKWRSDQELWLLAQGSRRRLANIRKSREIIRERLSHFAPFVYDQDTPMYESDIDLIPANNQRKKKWIIDNLCAAHRPVAISMLVSPSIGWESGEPGGHGLIITAFRNGPDGTIFQTRGSWGPTVNTVSESDLNRVMLMFTLRRKNHS